MGELHVITVPAEIHPHSRTPMPDTRVMSLMTPDMLVWLHLVASFFSTICLALVVFGLRDRLTTEMIRESLPNLLKVLTVYLIIWAGTELAIMGAFNQGISTLFAAIIGYVFGSYKSTPGGGSGKAIGPAPGKRPPTGVEP